MPQFHPSIPSTGARSSIELVSHHTRNSRGPPTHTRPTRATKRQRSDCPPKQSALSRACISSESPFALVSKLSSDRHSLCAPNRICEFPTPRSPRPGTPRLVRSCRGVQPFWIRFLRQLFVTRLPSGFLQPSWEPPIFRGLLLLPCPFPVQIGGPHTHASSRLLSPSSLDSLFASPPPPFEKRSKKKPASTNLQFRQFRTAPHLISFSPA